jgi:hypothetical protein
MNIHPVERKWWFIGPVSLCAVLSVFWLFSVAGWSDSFISPWSSSRAILFIATFYTIQRFYSFVLMLALAWLAPASLRDGKAAP